MAAFSRLTHEGRLGIASVYRQLINGRRVELEGAAVAGCSPRGRPKSDLAIVGRLRGLIDGVRPPFGSLECLNRELSVLTAGCQTPSRGRADDGYRPYAARCTWVNECGKKTLHMAKRPLVVAPNRSRLVGVLDVASNS